MRMENINNYPDKFYKSNSTGEEESEKNQTTQTKNDSEIPKDSTDSEHIDMPVESDPNQRDNLEKQFGDNFCAIQTTELEVRNEKPYDPRLEDSLPGRSGLKNGKEKSHCPIYYGIKSYLHDFYYPPDKEVLKSGDFMQGDDFRFLAEPRRKKNCWIRIGLWIGVNLMLLGCIGILVGYLIPQRETIVGQFAGYTIVDRWAVTFNDRLVLCRLTGMLTLACGTVVVVCSLLLCSCQAPPLPTYYVMGATVMPESFIGSPLADPRQVWGMHSIPLSGKLKGVQPNFITY